MTPVYSTYEIIKEGPHAGLTIRSMYNNRLYHELLAMLESDEWKPTDRQAFVSLMQEKIYEGMDVVSDELDYVDNHD